MKGTVQKGGAYFTAKRMRKSCGFTESADPRTITRAAFGGLLEARYLPLRGETRERWRQLCEQGTEEQDPEKLTKMIDEINRLLESKEERLLREQQEAKKETAN
jgi:hypothetical protein